MTDDLREQYLKPLRLFYQQNLEYREFVDKNAETYNKSTEDVMLMQITEEYRQSLLDGGCNSKNSNSNGKEE